MKLLMTSSANEHLLAPNYLNNFRQLGVQVEGIYHIDQFTSWHGKSLSNKLLFRVLPKIIYDEINQNLLQKAEEFKPDVMLIFKGMEIYPKTLKKIKQNKICLVNYNLDHPLRFNSRGSGNTNVRLSVSIYDLHFTYSQQIKQELREYTNGAMVHFLPFGYYEINDNFSFKGEEVQRACFVGYADKDRAKWIKALASLGLAIDVYGPRWNAYISSYHANIRVFPPQYNLDYWNTIRKYRVQLNIFRPHNNLSHNMRSFEVPSVGGIMLAPKTPEHGLFFEDSREAFFYESLEDCAKLARELLNLNAESADAIRYAARSRCQKSGYSYHHRAKEALRAIETIAH